MSKGSRMAGQTALAAYVCRTAAMWRYAQSPWKAYPASRHRELPTRRDPSHQDHPQGLYLNKQHYTLKR